MDFAKRPQDEECFGYHRNYVANVPDGSILDTLEHQCKYVPEFIQGIDEQQFDVVHPPYGWTIRTVVEHCCDAERVFGYRLLRFATGDTLELPGWDENRYASCGYATQVSQSVLATEFEGLRSSHLALLRRLQNECWDRIGTADGRQASVRTLAWLLAGHWLHHEKILRKRLNADAS